MRRLTALFLATGIALLAPGCGHDEPADEATEDTAALEVVLKGRPLADWVKDLESDVPRTRNLAVYELRYLGPPAAGAIPALVKALSHEDYDMQTEAAGALAAIGPKAVPELAKAIDDGRLHDDGLGYMDALGEAGTPLITPLFKRAVKAQREGHEKTWWSACNALEGIGLASFEYAAEQSRSGNEAVKLVAAHLFGTARTPEAKAVAGSALDALAKDPSEAVSEAAHDARRGLGDV